MLKVSYCIAILYIVSAVSLDAMSYRQKKTGDEDKDTYVEEDVWFGPGFYYGIWFENEDDYWEWRRNHKDYPSNRNYYHRERPDKGHYEEHHEEN